MARGAPDEGHDPTRREFFRTFSRQTVRNAGAVVGAANELQRSSLAAARELLELPEPASAAGPRQLVAEPITSEPASDFRSAYRSTGEAIVLLDQRVLPERVVTIEAREPNDLASAIRQGVVTPGPVLGEVAAHGISLAAAAAAARDRSAASLEQRVRAAAGTLRAARRDVGALVAAVDRMEGRFDVLAAGGATPDEIADGLAAEADAIALAGAAAHARIGRLAATVLTHARSNGAPTGALTDAQLTRPLNVLVHGDSGPLTCGLVGMSTACFRALIDAGMDLHVWVTAGAPSNEGARITAYQLAQSDVPSTVIPDTAVGWLVANGPIDAVLLRGDAVARNGDVAALVGALQVAQMARTAAVPVLVLASRVSVEPELSDLRGLLPHTGVPVADIVPAALISSVVTEEPG